MRYLRRIISCVSVLIILLYSVAALAESEASKKTILELGDKDGDGTLNLAELREVVPHATDTLFERLDTDGDGQLSTKDWHWNPSRPRARNNFPVLFRADTDNDQYVTFEEATTRFKQMTPAEFIWLDANSDGAIAPAEHSNTLRRPQGDSMRRVIDELLRADSDADGKATWKEIRIRTPKYPRSLFDWLDQDEDGAVSESDYRKPQRGR